MKTHHQTLNLFIALLILSSCRSSPASHEIVSREYDLQEILEVSEIRLPTGHLMKPPLHSHLTEAGDTIVKTHEFKLEFRSMEDRESNSFGRIEIQTEFTKYLIDEIPYWLPSKWKAVGIADSQQVQMLVMPNFEYRMNSDSSLDILQTHRILVSDSDALHSSTFQRDNEGNMIAIGVSAQDGISSLHALVHMYRSTENGVVEVKSPEKGLGFEDKNKASKYKSIFGSTTEIVGSYQSGFVEK